MTNSSIDIYYFPANSTYYVPDTRKSGEGNYPKDLPKKEQDEGTR
jgi:hypothetical protein